MTRVLFVEYCAKDILDGTQNMDAITELAYRRIIDMIYSTNDRLLDNDSLQYATKTGAKWKKIRQELIDVHKKIYIEDGYIRNRKCTEKIEKSRKNVEQKRIAQSAMIERRNTLKNQETGIAAASAAATADAVANQKPNNQLSPSLRSGEDARAEEPPGEISKPKTKGRKNAGQRFADWCGWAGLAGGAIPSGWGDYPAKNFGWSEERTAFAFRAFERYWTGPDARNPVKRDWRRAWENWCDTANSRGDYRSGENQRPSRSEQVQAAKRKALAELGVDAAGF